MKLVLLISGIVIFLFASFRLLQFAFMSKSLGEFEMGYIVGNIFLLIAGIILFYFARRKPKSNS